MSREATKLRIVAGLAEALQQAANTGMTRYKWTCAPSSEGESQSPLPSSNVIVLSVRLRGELQGRLQLALPLAQLSSQAASSTDAELLDSSKWIAVLDEFVRRIPKRSMDVTRFGFNAESHETKVVEDGQKEALLEIEIGMLLLQAHNGPELTVFLLADAELAQSLMRASVPVEGVPYGDEASHPIERVIDVPLDVTLRFGERQMVLRDILELSTGSLVELNRRVEEPVDMMLEDRVIARGDVVIVDGNYGLRITEIVERKPFVKHSRIQ